MLGVTSHRASAFLDQTGVDSVLNVKVLYVSRQIRQ